MLVIDNEKELAEVDVIIELAKKKMETEPSDKLRFCIKIITGYRTKAESSADLLERLQATARAHAAAGIINVMLTHP